MSRLIPLMPARAAAALEGDRAQLGGLALPVGQKVLATPQPVMDERARSRSRAGRLTCKALCLSSACLRARFARPTLGRRPGPPVAVTVM